MSLGCDIDAMEIAYGDVDLYLARDDGESVGVREIAVDGPLSHPVRDELAVVVGLLCEDRFGIGDLPNLGPGGILVPVRVVSLCDDGELLVRRNGTDIFRVRSEADALHLAEVDRDLREHGEASLGYTARIVAEYHPVSCLAGSVHSVGIHGTPGIRDVPFPNPCVILVAMGILTTGREGEGFIRRYGGIQFVYPYLGRLVRFNGIDMNGIFLRPSAARVLHHQCECICSRHVR